MSRDHFIDSSAKFSAWTKNALKYWASNAADPRGGYAEHLKMDGTPDFNTLRRVRVQARQAYVYAHAAHLGWYSKAKEASDHAWDFVIGPGSQGGEHFIKGSSRGCAHLVRGDGVLHDETRDTYAQAFVLLSGAWRYKAFSDQRSLEQAKSTLNYLNMNVKAQNGGWLEALPTPRTLQRRQNPHMHLFEAFLALYDATQDNKYLSLSNHIFELFENHFFDSRRNVLREFFTSDWQPDGDGGPIEPGHMMEWCWLLRVYERLSGKDINKYATALYEGALRYGWNSKLGLLYDAVNVDGSAYTATLRTWPQTELIKASVVQAAAGNEEMYAAAANAIDALFKNYLSVQVVEGWADKLSKDGLIISKVMPTSTFYHLFCASAEANTLVQKIQ